MPDSDKTQLDKEAARDLETDDDLERFKEKPAKLVKQMPVLDLSGKIGG